MAAAADALDGQVALAEAASEDAARLEAELAGARAEQERVAAELCEVAGVAAAARAEADQAGHDLAALGAEFG